MLMRPRRRIDARWMRALVTLAFGIVLADALIGDQSLSTARRARQQYHAVAAQVAALQLQNSSMREEARRLREEPETIEDLARKDLGLARPGEMVVVLK